MSNQSFPAYIHRRERLESLKNRFKKSDIPYGNTDHGRNNSVINVIENPLRKITKSNEQTNDKNPTNNVGGRIEKGNTNSSSNNNVPSLQLPTSTTNTRIHGASKPNPLPPPSKKEKLKSMQDKRLSSNRKFSTSSYQQIPSIDTNKRPNPLPPPSKREKFKSMQKKNSIQIKNSNGPLPPPSKKEKLKSMQKRKTRGKAFQFSAGKTTETNTISSNNKVKYIEMSNLSELSIKSRNKRIAHQNDISATMLGANSKEKDLPPFPIVSPKVTNRCFFATLLLATIPIISFFIIFISIIHPTTTPSLKEMTSIYEWIDCYTNSLLTYTSLLVIGGIPILIQLLGIARLHYRRSLFGTLFCFSLFSYLIVSFVGRIPDCSCAGTPRACPLFVFDRDILNECVQDPIDAPDSMKTVTNQTTVTTDSGNSLNGIISCEKPIPNTTEISNGSKIDVRSDKEVCNEPVSLVQGICNAKNTEGSSTFYGFGKLRRQDIDIHNLGILVTSANILTHALDQIATNVWTVFMAHQDSCMKIFEGFETAPLKTEVEDKEIKINQDFLVTSKYSLPPFWYGPNGIPCGKGYANESCSEIPLASVANGDTYNDPINSSTSGVTHFKAQHGRKEPARFSGTQASDFFYAIKMDGHHHMGSGGYFWEPKKPKIPKRRQWILDQMQDVLCASQYYFCDKNDLIGVPKPPCDTACRKLAKGFKEMRSTCSEDAIKEMRSFSKSFKSLCYELTRGTLDDLSGETTTKFTQHVICDGLIEMMSSGNATICESEAGIFAQKSKGEQCYEMENIKRFNKTREQNTSPSPSKPSSSSNNETCECKIDVNQWFQNSILITFLLPTFAYAALWLHLFKYTKTRSFKNCFVGGPRSSPFTGSNCAQFLVLLLLPLAQLGISLLLCVIGLYLTNKSIRVNGDSTVNSNVTFSSFVFYTFAIVICTDAILSITRSLAPPGTGNMSAKVVITQKKKSTMVDYFENRISAIKRESSVSSLTFKQNCVTHCSSCAIRVITRVQKLISIYHDDFSYETGLFYLEFQLAAEAFEVGNQVYQMHVFSKVRDYLYLQVVCVLLILNGFSMLLPFLLRRYLHAERSAKNMLVVCDTLLDVSYLVLALYFLSTCQFQNEPFLSTVSIIMPSVFTVDKLRDVVEYTRNQVSEHMIRVALGAKRTIAAKDRIKSFSRQETSSSAEFIRRVPPWVQMLHMILSIIGALITFTLTIIFIVSARNGYTFCENTLGKSLWEGSYPRVVILFSPLTTFNDSGKCDLNKIRQIKVSSDGINSANYEKLTSLPHAITKLKKLEILDVRNQSISPNGIPWQFLDGKTLKRLRKFDCTGNPVSKSLDLTNQGAVIQDSFPAYALLYMKELESIDISNTSVTCLPELPLLIQHLPSLSKINVSNNNQLEWISPMYILNAPITIDVTSTVKNINWAHQISKGTSEKYLWDQLAFHFPFIKSLDLSNNEITCIPTNTFIKFQNLEKFNFAHNNFQFGEDDCQKEHITGDLIAPEKELKAVHSFWKPFCHHLSPLNLNSINLNHNKIISFGFMNKASVCSSNGCHESRELSEPFLCSEIMHLTRLKDINVYENFASLIRSPFVTHDFGSYNRTDYQNGFYPFMENRLHYNQAIYCTALDIKDGTLKNINMGLDLSFNERKRIFTLVKLIYDDQLLTKNIYAENTAQLLDLEYPSYKPITRDNCMNENVFKPHYCTGEPRNCAEKPYNKDPHNLDVSLLSLENIALNKKLAVLILDRMHVTGKLPLDIHNTWPLLSSVALSYTDIHGIIPPNIGKLTALKRFEISGGACIEGTVPKELGNGKRLQESLAELVIRDLPLMIGTIPQEISNLKFLKRLDFSNTNIWPCNCTVGDTFCEKERLDGSHIPRDKDGKKIVELIKVFLTSSKKPRGWGNCKYCRKVCVSGQERFDCDRNQYYTTSTKC